MDLFEYLPNQKVLVCRPCRIGVPPKSLKSHMQSKHRQDHNDLRGRNGPSSVARELRLRGAMPLCDPSLNPIALPHPNSDAIASLELHQGFQCLRCPQILGCTKGITQHLRTKHSIVRQGPGRPSNASRRSPNDWSPVTCQRLFASGHQSKYFAVLAPEETRKRQAAADRGARPQLQVPTRTDLARAEIYDRLAAHQQCVRTDIETVSEHVDKTEVSPWLQLTRWSTYLHGHTLCDAAKLADLPRAGSEPLLEVLCKSVDRVVEKAQRSIREDRINVFDRVRINSFSQQPRFADKPLMAGLLKSTYRTYTTIWKRLICFACRTALPGQGISLRHYLSTAQRLVFDRMMTGAEALHLNRDTECDDAEERNARLDHDCLRFCVSLLDHDLRGCLFESTVVGFLAVLGIDEKKGLLSEAYHYTPILSGFIKISQFLVVQYAVDAAANGEVAQSADLLDSLRNRFMVHTTRSPFSWACRLRTYGKRIRDSTTCYGYISWTVDGQIVSYRDISGLRMDHFKQLVRGQVEQARVQMEQLLYIRPGETRGDLGINFQMNRLVDDAAEGRFGWNFLQDTRNLEGELPNREDWLLERVIENDWLRDDFMAFSETGKVVWNQKTVLNYKEKVDAFLKSLLLLVHLTSGQPARGTELLSLRHSNTMQGHHRNIFVDNGMISTVTSYHKGYAVSGSTKIIHRYVPNQVGELLIYYLWLILPFWQRLDALALHRTGPDSPFLWPKGQGPWKSGALAGVIGEAFQSTLNLAVNIATYRHLAIAISRKHLRCGGFRRDYGIKDTETDKQAAHSSLTAGLIYARGLEEAAGHVEARKAAYQSVSLQWHEFLGL